MPDFHFCGNPQTATERLLNIVKIFRYGEHRTPGRRVLPHLRPIWEH